jgi:hypothetical protein
MLRVLCFDGTRLVIGDLRLLVVVMVCLLVVFIVHLLVEVVVVSILYLHLPLNLQCAVMRFGLSHFGFGGVTHVGLVFAGVISQMNKMYRKEAVL